AVFTDIGDAWVDGERDRDLKIDGGIGVQNADANLRIDLARRLDDRDPAVILSGRIQRMF
ncbi:MAG: hypothetical protein KC591_01605, partial [Gemmatimonadetes bacterium]|nr:hypothetical protein [Gemmatimonadota bacterium]